MIAEIFEIIMIVCFGFSWPMNVIKSYRSRTTKGKSLPFLLLIIYQAVNFFSLLRRYRKEQMDKLQAERDQIAAEREENARMMAQLQELKAQLEAQMAANPPAAPPAALPSADCGMTMWKAPTATPWAIWKASTSSRNTAS